MNITMGTEGWTIWLENGYGNGYRYGYGRRIRMAIRDYGHFLLPQNFVVGIHTGTTFA